METDYLEFQKNQTTDTFGCPYEEWKPMEAAALAARTGLSDVPMRNGNLGRPTVLLYLFFHFRMSL